MEPLVLCNQDSQELLPARHGSACLEPQHSEASVVRPCLKKTERDKRNCSKCWDVLPGSGLSQPASDTGRVGREQTSEMKIVQETRQKTVSFKQMVPLSDFAWHHVSTVCWPQSSGTTMSLLKPARKTRLFPVNSRDDPA